MATLTQYGCDKRQTGRAIKAHRRDAVACAIIIADLSLSEAPRTKYHGDFLRLINAEIRANNGGLRIPILRAFNRLQTRRFNAITRHILSPSPAIR